MGKGYKKYLALALSIALILESQVMSVSAASSNFDSNDKAIETLAEDGDNSQEAEPGDEPVFEENAEGEADGQYDEGLLTEPGSDQNPDEGYKNLIDDDEKLREYDLEEGDEDGFGEDLDKDLEEGLEEDLEHDLEEELGEDLDESLVDGIDGEAKPMLGASTLAEASEDFDIRNGDLFKYNGTDEDVSIPDGVVEIRSNAFDTIGIKSVKLPKSVKFIDDFAFYRCWLLREINLENVTRIEWAAFFECKNISKVTISKAAACEKEVFLCSKIRQLYFEDGRTEIPQNMLADAEIQHIYIPDSVTSIGYIPGGAIIHGETGSYAHQYAKENNHRFFNNKLTIEGESTISIIDGGSSEGEFIWESDDETIATVDKTGVVTGVSNGTCTVNAKTSDGTVIGSCAVTVDGIIENFEIRNGVLIKYNGMDIYVVIPDGVKIIGEKAFYNYDILEHIYIPESVTEIEYIPEGAIIHGEPGSFAQQYANDYGFKFESYDWGNFEIQNGVLVKYYGTDEDVVIPYGVVEIGRDAFAYHDGIKSVKLPKSVNVIGNNAFHYCWRLNDINLENVKRIKWHAFEGARNITKITISKETVCEEGVFFEAGIRQLYFEDGRTEIPENMLNDSKIEHIYVPSSVTSIGYIPGGAIIHGETGSYAHQYAKENNRRFFNNKLTIEGESIISIIDGGSSEGEFIWESDDETIATVDKTGVVTGVSNGTCTVNAKTSDGTVIGSCAVTVDGIIETFEIRNGVLVKYDGTNETVVIPDGVTEIGRDVFRDNEIIKSVRIPDSVKVIGPSAFNNCLELEHINLENVERIGKEAFFYCLKLEEADLEKAVEIGDLSFFYCEKIKQLNLENTERIGKYAFYSCVDLEDVNLGKAIEIGDSAFRYCENIEYINLENVEKIGRYAFNFCGNLKEVKLGKAVEIGNYTFAQCESINNIELPDSLEKLGTGAFNAHADIPTVTIPKGTVCGNLVFCDSNIKQLFFEDGTKEIPQKMLDGAKIKHIYIPNSVVAIGNIPSGTIIHGETGSFAQQYANEHDIRFFNREITVEAGSTISVIDGGSSEGEFIWESDDETIATADKKGIVTGVSKGTCTVNAKTSDGTSIDSCVVSVGGGIIETFEIKDGVLVKYNGTDEDVVIPDGVVEIGEEAFGPALNEEGELSCNKVKNVKLPESVKVISDRAFYECLYLEHINLENVEKIGESAFGQCIKLEDIDLRNVVEIGGNAFASCESIKNIELPSSLKKLGDYAFAYCEGISKITIPKGTECGVAVLSQAHTRQVYFEDGRIEIPRHMLDFIYEGPENWPDDVVGYVGLQIYVPKSVIFIGSIPEGATIHGETGSFAQQYAKDNSLRFFNSELSAEAGSTISVIDGGSSEGEFVWETDNESIATVDATGVVSGLSEGSCKISAKTADGAEIGSCVMNVTGSVRIVPIDELSISQIEAQEYIGGEIQPKPEVKDGETVLEEGRDYTLTYASNKAVGTGYVTITGVPENGYEGSKKISFKIKAFDVAKNEDERFVISYEDTVEYSTSGAKPKVSVSFNNADGTTKKLKEGTDYTVSYKNNKKYNSTVKPTIVITAKGSYTGKKEIQFTLKERDISKASMVATDMIWLGWPDTYYTITVITDSGYILKQGTDYESLKYVYANKTVVKVNGKKVTRNAGDTIGKNDIIPADTTLKVIATAKKGSGYTGTISATYKLYSIGSIFRWIFG